MKKKKQHVPQEGLLKSVVSEPEGISSLKEEQRTAKERLLTMEKIISLFSQLPSVQFDQSINIIVILSPHTESLQGSLS